MTLTRWSPMTDFFNVQKEMDRLFGSVLTRPKDEDYDSAVWSPRVDITESADEYTMFFDIPGVEKSDVRMNFSDNTLKVSGERRVFNESNDRTTHRVERIFGKFFRSFTFPTSVNPDKIKAIYKDGVLTVTVPKSEESKPKQISIN